MDGVRRWPATSRQAESPATFLDGGRGDGGGEEVGVIRTLVLALVLAGCAKMKDRCTARNASKSICTTRHGEAVDVTTCVYECSGKWVEPQSGPEQVPEPVLVESER
jgi:hypothetical protein